MSGTVYVGSVPEMAEAISDLVRLTGLSYQQASRTVVADTAREVQLMAQAYAPVKTGWLRSSIGVRFSNDGMTAEVYTGVPYAIYQELGTRGPYKIRPVRAKFLRFEVNGKVVFAKEVTHPGIPPAYFMGRAAQNAMTTMAPRINALACQMIRRWHP